MNGLEKMFGIKLINDKENEKMSKLIDEYEKKFGFLNLNTEEYISLEDVNIIIEECLCKNKKVEELYPGINDIYDNI